MTAPTVTALSAAQLAAVAADAPILLTDNQLYEASGNGSYDLRANQDGLFNTADDTDSDYPITRLYDSLRSTLWKTTNTGANQYILMDAGAEVNADVFVAEGFYDNVPTSITIRCSNGLSGNALDGDAVDFGGFTPDSDGSICVGLAGSTLGARYWEIKFTYGSSKTGYASQVWLGSRTQFDHKAYLPFDPLHVESERTESETRKGSTQNVPLYHGRRRVVGDWFVESSAFLAQLRIAYANTDGWERPFWYVEDPTSDAHDGLFVLQERRGLYIQQQIGTTAIPDGFVNLDMVEQLPRGKSATI